MLRRNTTPSKFNYIFFFQSIITVFALIICLKININHSNKYPILLKNNGQVNLKDNRKIILYTYYNKRKNKFTFAIKKYNLIQIIRKKRFSFYKNFNLITYSRLDLNRNIPIIVPHSKIKTHLIFNYIKCHKSFHSIAFNSFISLLTIKRQLKVSSDFSLNRLNPITGNITLHKGIDIALPINTPLFAVSKGKVISVKNGNIAGNYIAIIHNKGYITRYMHMNKILVKLGQKIHYGDKIGLSGNTGRSTGPHLHFELWINNQAINPLTVYLPNHSIRKKQIS
ncbi:hypothetical protein CRV10_00690 [Candidatus Pantoea edessiphila]|uniref:M23ase beta-sheet core domain-containing protein n=1 Tax=Candidatus Pantoea edessiphila TaxID=2044610 RepID=A0A2P5SX96_9GAMM|nr:hypothetical protein CRV10_00690 [Candidatus Pantoea edessiphila]